MAYMEFEDAQAALTVARALVSKERWTHHEDAQGRRHAYHRLRDPFKDPTLRSDEIELAFATPGECTLEQEQTHFFRLRSQIEGDDWTGWARILFHVQADYYGATPHRVVIVTAFRESGWTPTHAS